MRKPFAALMALVLTVGSILPGIHSASSQTASAYAPPLPTLPAPTTSPFMEPDQASQSLPTPPAPDDLPPEVEETRARQAIEAVLEKYLRYWGPRYQVALVRVRVEGEWAYGVAQWQSQARPLEEPIHILAHRSTDGIWQALMPGSDGLYLQWLDAVPESLVPAGEKRRLRAQTAEAGALRQSQDLAVTVTLPSREEPSEPVESVPGPAQPTATPILQIQQTTVPLVLNTADWLVYEDTNYGFAVRYPPNWFLNPTERSGGGEVATITSYPPNDVAGETPTLHSVDFAKAEIGVFLHNKPSTQSLKEWTRPAEWMLPSLVQERELSINGVDTIQRTYHREQMFISTTYIPRGTKVYFVSITTLTSTLPIDVLTVLNSFTYTTPYNETQDAVDHLYPQDSFEFLGNALPMAPVGFRLPFDGSYPISNGPGEGYHTGSAGEAVDFPMVTGTAVKATEVGNVTFADWDSSGYGWSIRLHHDNGMDSWYAHLSTIQVSVGQRPSKGQQIALSGNTGGASTGPHLHFHVKSGSSPVCIRDLSDIWWNTWFPPGDPNYYSGCACYPPCGSPPSQCYQGARRLSCGGGSDTTPPDGEITSPGEGDTITSRTVHLAGWAQDNAGGSGFNHAHFTAYYNGNWRQVGPDFTSSPFGFDWDMCNDAVPNGPVTIGLDIWDNEGNQANSPHGVRHFTKNYNCDSACPQSGGVILYWNANYDCNNNEGDPGYRQRTSIGWQNVDDGQFNDKASSVKVPPGWSVRLFAHADREEPSVCFNADVSDFGTQGDFPGSNISINDNVSSIEVFDNGNCGSTIDDAEFVSQSPYPTVQAGQPFSVYFEVRNSGNTTWRDSDGYGLENINGQPLGAWQRQEIGSDVPPGATKRWDIQMTAPSSPGLYRTQWMLNHWGNTFGPNMFIDVTVVPASIDDAEFVSQSPYPTVQAGQPFSIYFEVRNSGNTTWRDSDGYGLENINDQPLGAWHRQEIGSDVLPGATKRWDIQMTAPSSPGLYRTQWMLNHWGNTFGPNMFIDVTVVPAPDPPTLISPSNGATLPDDADITLDWNSSSGATEYYAHLWGGPSIDIDSDWIGSTDWHIGQLWPGTYSWQIQARNQYGESNWSGTWSFTVAEPVAIGPLVYDSHTVDDDGNDQSSGDGDGIVECGESIELYVTLSNLGDGIATGVNATISTSDPYVTWLDNTSSSYPDIPSGGTGTNSNDFDFAVDSSIPDGHIIQFDLNINASNGGPWSDSFDSTVVCPRPDLHPYAPPNYPYPVVPSSTTGTHEVNMLVADPSIDTYFDWHFINDGSGVAPGTFYMELWVDGTRHVRYPEPDFQPGWVGGFDDWAVCISEPGWHTVRLIADPDDNVDEANETNNVWERQFYWASVAPYATDVESGASDWTATGLWHQVDQYTSPYPESRSWSHSWWYGQDGTGDYDTGSGNSGHLTSPPVYIPSAGYYLRFWSWYETETHGGSWDSRWIQISADGGEFESVLQLVSDPMQEWTPSPAIDLSSYAGSVIRFRLDFDTVDGAYNGYRGWYVDDFSISSTPPSVCSDSHEPNNWTGEATFISYGDSLDAQVCPQGDLDFYAFSGAVGNRIIIDIDARVSGSNLDSYVYLLDSDGSTYLAENDDAYGSLDSHLVYDLPHDGTYYIKVRTYSHPNSGGVNHFYTLHLLTDNVNPTTQITSPTSDGYLDLTATNITVEASDDESGVSRVEFLWHDGDWQNSDWVWLGADWDGSDGWSYEWDTSAITDQSGIALYVWAFDWAGNWTGAGAWSLTLDRTPPTATASVSPMYGDAPFRDFHVWWHGSDDLSGIASYDVQYRDGAGGTWTDLLTNTDDTYTRFVGFDGHTYYFRTRARDRAGNQSTYASGNGDVQHKVEICYTPPDAYEVDDTRANARWIIPDASMQVRSFYAQGDRDWVRFYAATGITYTLMTTNTGGHADTVLYLYDKDGTTLITSNDDAPDMWPASRIDWQPSTGGFYWAKVEHWDPWAYGCTTGYGLSITGSRPTPFSQVYLPLMVRDLDPSHSPPTAVETLNFRVSFYGRDNGADEPQNVPIKVTIKNLSLDHVLFESGWVAVTPASGSDNWGTASVDVSSAGLVSGQHYQVFVRGAMHLAKRVAVPLTDGMTLDYTDVDLNPDSVLWTCDVNQDNQVNREDMTRIVSHYGQTAPTTPDPSSELYRSDQNGDEVVNVYDWGICIDSYGKVGDPY
jgi:murein DD-endopeptidase MepM/ murein hydrolase activator NlpD